MELLSFDAVDTMPLITKRIRGGAQCEKGTQLRLRCRLHAEDLSGLRGKAP
jgi:hypothetical protein